MVVIVMCSRNETLNMRRELFLIDDVRDVAIDFSKVSRGKLTVLRQPLPVQRRIWLRDEVPESIRNSKEIERMDFVKEVMAPEIHLMPHLSRIPHTVHHIRPTLIEIAKMFQNRTREYDIEALGWKWAGDTVDGYSIPAY